MQRDVKLARRKYYYYSNAVEKLKSTNSSRWWKEVKSLGGLKSNESWLHQLSDVKPTFQDLAESYNQFLIGLTSHFEPLLEYSSGQKLQVPGNLLVHTGQVFSDLKRLKTTKSPGPGMIPNKILTTFAFEFAPVITDIFNTSMKQGIFPDQLIKAFIGSPYS